MIASKMEDNHKQNEGRPPPKWKMNHTKWKKNPHKMEDNPTQNGI